MGRKERAAKWQIASGEVRFETDGTIQTLYLDQRPSSAINLADPSQVVFAYLQWIDAIISTLNWDLTTKVEALHLGGAGCSLPIAWSYHYPKLRQTVVEIDQDLIALVRSQIDLPQRNFKLRGEDAAKTLQTTRQARWEVIVRDLFSAGVVPLDFQRIGFFQQVQRALSPSGIYLANEVGPWRAQIEAMKQFFPFRALVAPQVVQVGRRIGNAILLGSKIELDWERIRQALAKTSEPVSLRVFG